MILSVAMMIHYGDETDPRTMIWFGVFMAACGVFFLLDKIDPPGTPKPAPVQKVQYWKVYHGTPSWNNAASAIQNGLVPGPGGAFGIGVYTAFDYSVAQSYARGGG